MRGTGNILKEDGQESSHDSRITIYGLRLTDNGKRITVCGEYAVWGNGRYEMEKAAAATRTENLIRQTIEYLSRKVRVQQAILFGSHARGEADEWSDVDLAVISSDFAGMSHAKRMDLLVEISLAVDPSVEVRPYTPRDLKEARPTNFLGHILAEGKVVYEQGKFLF
jgi:predicted nucleotidyltransferase